MIETTLYDKSIKEMCINDVNETTYDDKIWVQTILQDKFKEKCIYEI